MQTLKRIPQSRRGGWAMVVTMFVIVVAATAVSLIMSSSVRSDRTAKTTRRSTDAFFRAEGGLEFAERELLVSLAEYRTPPAEGTVEIGGEEVTYRIAPTGLNFVQTDPSGIQSRHARYQIDATGSITGAQDTVHRVLDVVSVPIFQFAVFYSGDLEINPGPDMTLSGRIHTNGDLYLNAGNRLTLDTNYVRAVGKLLRHRKDDPSRSSGIVDIRQWVADPFDPSAPSVFFGLDSREAMEAAGITSISGYDSNFMDGYDSNGDGDFTDIADWLPWALGALEYWREPTGYTEGTGSTVQTADHGLSSAIPPGIGSVSMFEPTGLAAGGDYTLDAATGTYELVSPLGTGTHNKGYFHSEADLSILVQPDGTWKAYDALDNEITDSLVGVVEVDTIYDARQGSDVQVARVDMAALSANTAFPDNGLLYTGGYGIGTGGELQGVELYNGAELAGPLTVVTEGAAYVQGDYNVTNKVGAAVIADAVNLLSNAWDGTKSSGDLPDAGDTTFNLAFITGNHETSEGDYNGGFENLPRFHEDWGGVDCNIAGSFVNAWLSQYATGEWEYGGDRYTAPRRNWSYDTFFNTAGNLPPYTPSVVRGVNVVFWE